MSTSSFSSMKLRQPSLGTKAAIFLPFLISCTRALTDSRVGLLSLNADLLQNDPLGVGGPGEGLLPLRTQVGLLVVLVRPQLLTAKLAQLAPGPKPARLTHGGFLASSEPS